MEDKILQIKNISKRFIAVQALKNVSFDLKQGEVHALVGENGAGKSTLSKIIAGVYEADKGKLLFKGVELAQGNPMLAQKKGIFMIPQDLGLIPKLNVMHNILLGRAKTKAGFIDLQQSKKICEDILNDIGIHLDLDMPVNRLPIDKQQLVAIAKVLSANAELIILDEPTSTLSDSEVETLFRIMGNLKRKNITMIYISHRLDEIYRIADRVTILKDGTHVKTCKVSDINKEDLINNMVGRNLSKAFPPKRKSLSDSVIMKLRNLTVDKKLLNIDLDVRKGEILGIGGLVGMGQTTLLNAIYGSQTIDEGYLEYQGKKYNRINAKTAIKLGITYISSDRRGEMLFTNRSVKENISIATLEDYQQAGVIYAHQENNVVDGKIDEYNISISNREQEVQFLSGGNQQKSILARWLINEPKILLLDEPTQGIDVGTKEDIYKSLRDLANNGISVIVVFSDMNELLGMSDRIAVIYEGRLIKVFTAGEASEEKIMAAASDHLQQ